MCLIKNLDWHISMAEVVVIDYLVFIKINGGRTMKLECSVEELKLLFKNFELKETNIKIDGAKVAEKIAPSISNVLKNADI